MNLADFDQDDKLKNHEKRIKRLETALGKDEMEVSPVLKSLVGRDCYLDSDDEFGEIECRIEDVDEEWVKITSFRKKETATEILRIESITKIKLK